MAKISLFELTKMLNKDNQRISTSEELFRQIAEHCSCTGLTIEAWGEVGSRLLDLCLGLRERLVLTEGRGAGVRLR